jgi:hypothetical protein
MTSRTRFELGPILVSDSDIFEEFFVDVKKKTNWFSPTFVVEIEQAIFHGGVAREGVGMLLRPPFGHTSTLAAATKSARA